MTSWKPLWTDHLINLQEVRVGFLDAASAESLLTAPCPEMPADAIPLELARAMVARTAGQPYLTQLYGQILIDQLNDAERRQATLDDVEPVEREALSKGTNYFHNIWRALRPDAAQALLALAQGQAVALDAATRRYLQRRLLIGEDEQLLIPVFQRWLLENQLEAEEGLGTRGLIQKIVFAHSKTQQHQNTGCRACAGVTMVSACPSPATTPSSVPRLASRYPADCPGFSHQLQRARAFQATIRHLCLFAG